MLGGVLELAVSAKSMLGCGDSWYLFRWYSS